MSDSNQVPGDKPKLPDDGNTPPQYEAPAAYTPPAESVDYSAPAASGTDYTPPAASGTDSSAPSSSGGDYTPPSSSGGDYTPPSAAGSQYTPPAASGSAASGSAASGSVSYTPPSEPAAAPSAAPYSQAPSAGQAPAYGSAPGQGQGQPQGYGATQGYATPGYPTQSATPKRTLSIVGLSLGGVGVLLGLLGQFYLGLPLGVAGLICAIMAKKREPQAGAIRTWGFWVSIAAIVISAIVGIIFIAGAALFLNEMSGYGY
ncbi:hypothetical protein [Pseudoclavibacter sp. RFBB5]|uniref:hypothetical protein n=1 Tax=Pseudoclavibacter sp. RFBB5 TaxID=2080574 RepID=UPI000CE7C74B|nr:hypothetical protein [Pseudoclavibacter sp. RFBB5]PPG28015.1 hypothetical protein C5B97_14155 [Pseudoclavibacter sp. RFBB5]